MILAGGCAAAGVAAYKVMGPADVPAKYVPAKEPMLVLVENYSRPSSAFTDSELLSRFLVSNLKTNNVAPIIDLNTLREFQASHASELHDLSVAALGRQLGAKQVLYIDVTKNDIEPLLGGETLRGEAAVRVKIVDVATGETRWPLEMSEGYPLSFSTSLGSATRGESEIALKQRMYANLGDRIAKLFYKWKPEETPPEGFTETQ
jgi:hypothetical protein